MKQQEKFQPYLTSRSEVQKIDLLENNVCEIGLDWVSIYGVFHAEQYKRKLHANNWVQLDELDTHPIKFGLKRISDNGELLEDVNVATLTRNKGKNKKQGNWRLETSNHIKSKKEKRKIINIIDLFEEMHITRLDVAIDYINFANAGMKYRFYKPNTTQYWIIEKNGKMGTIYCGSSGSNVQYRYYNKLNERKHKRIKLPDNIKSWERLEIKLRGKNTLNWLDETKKALTYFKCPDIVKLDNEKISTVAMLEYLIKHPDRLNNKYLSKGTLAKYRKMLKQNKGLDNHLSLVGLDALSKREKTLREEINSYLGTNELKEVS